MTALADLYTARDNMAHTLADISANPKPNYSISGDGGSRSFSWTEYQKFLIESIAGINAAINVLAPYQEGLRHSL